MSDKTTYGQQAVATSIGAAMLAPQLPCWVLGSAMKCETEHNGVGSTGMGTLDWVLVVQVGVKGTRLTR